MSLKYQNLLSPMKVGNVVFKNRMIASPGKPHFIQGAEPYPAEGTITHYANKARNGAALVTCSASLQMPDDYTGDSRKRNTLRHLRDTGFYANQNYFGQMTEAIHFYGAKASMQIRLLTPDQYDVSSGIPSHSVYGDGSVSVPGKEIPAAMLEEIADEYALHATLFREMGFDGVFIHMSYRLSLMGRFLSRLTNKRTDQFGGSLDNQARFPIMVADRIKQACGRDFLIEASLSGSDPTPDGQTLEDTIEYARMFSGHIDLLQLREHSIDPAHPTGFNLERTPFLYMAEAVKKSGADIAVVTIGGYQDLDVCEDVIASGKADFIAMARSWISNPDYGRKAYEGRNEDVVPCLRCNGCHRSSDADPWASVCAVNPVWGLEHRIDRMIDPPTSSKKVAVIGGGPAGMEAALIAADRGHQVTLYEKSGALGGLLKTTENVSFKWPHKDFKDYLIRQISKSNVRVALNTEATPEIIKDGKYDAVMAAVGSEPVVPPIPGADGDNVVFAVDVYGNEDSLAKNVVVIGGGEVGVETGMHLAENGHKVTVLEIQDILAPDAVPIHYYIMFQEAWEKLENFSYILEATCTVIGADSVAYTSADGTQRQIEAGSVVVAAGMKAKTDLALEFSGTGDRFFIIGDCSVAGNVQKAMRSAFSTASTL